MELKTLCTCINIALWFLWPVSAWAATKTLGNTVAGLDVLSILMTLVISLLSGLTSLLHSMKSDIEKTGEIKHVWLYVCSKMLGSTTAGLMVLFWTEGRLDPNMQAGVIIIAAFGGTWFLERALVRFMDKVAPVKET